MGSISLGRNPQGGQNRLCKAQRFGLRCWAGACWKTCGPRFDPFDMDEIEVWFNGGKVKTAKELDLRRGTHYWGLVQKKEEAKSSSKGSRYLKALQEKEKGPAPPYPRRSSLPQTEW